MSGATGLVDLPEIDAARAKRAKDILAAYQANAAKRQGAANQQAALYGDPAAAGPTVANATARGSRMVQDVADRWAAHGAGRTDLANIWLTGLRAASQNRLAQQEFDASKRFGGGGSGGGGGRRRSSSGGSGGGGSLTYNAPAAQQDPIQVLADWIRKNRAAAPSRGAPSRGAPAGGSGGAPVRLS